MNPTHLTHLRFAKLYNANVSFWLLSWGKTQRRSRPRRWRWSRIVEEVSTEFWLSYWVKHKIWRESESERKGLRLYIETNAQWRDTKRAACTHHVGAGRSADFCSVLPRGCSCFTLHAPPWSSAVHVRSFLHKLCFVSTFIRPRENLYSQSLEMPLRPITINVGAICFCKTTDLQSWTICSGTPGTFPENAPFLPEKCCNYKCFGIHIVMLRSFHRCGI